MYILMKFNLMEALQNISINIYVFSMHFRVDYSELLKRKAECSYRQRSRHYI